MNPRFAALTLGLAATLGAVSFPLVIAGEEPPRTAAGAKLGEETPLKGETVFIGAMKKIQDGLNLKNAGRRGQHPKQHGCVVAKFVVHDGLPKALRHGVFREPKTYTAVIRFSNGATFDDRTPDAHGMAIKLVGVAGKQALDTGQDGKTQDFVLMDHPVFFAKNIENLVGLTVALGAAKAAGNNKPLEVFAAAGHADEVRLVTKDTKKLPPNPLQIQYWSTVPSRLGPGAVKYTAKPREPAAKGQGPGTSENYLRAAMAARLSGSKGPVIFDFCVQRQADPARQPIEDATVAWTTPEEPVASILIEPQEFDTPEQLEFCENLIYTPWHALNAHRPLGSINRARKPIYPVSAGLRHEIRKKEGKEPSSEAEPTEADLNRFRRPPRTRSDR